LSAKTIKVLGKRNKERVLPILGAVIPLIRDYIDKRNVLTNVVDNEYFFLTEKGVKMYESLVYGIINKYFSSISDKVKKSPHVLRHSFATHLLNNGADLNSVKELLGHSSLASTQIYVNSSLSELKKVHIKAHPRNIK
jgi:integrase/recombinase XerC